ncbi:MAG: sugar-binding protein, partial [Akkermansia sp.]|nr:sugar-binding protein [Akkermansia sp.]
MSSIVFHIENCAVLGLQPTAVIVPIIDPVHNPEVITLNYAAGKQSNMFDVNPPIYRLVLMDGECTVEASGTVDDSVHMLLPELEYIDPHPGTEHAFRVGSYTPSPGVYFCSIVHHNINYYPLPTGNVSILHGTVGFLPPVKIDLPVLNVKKEPVNACEFNGWAGGEDSAHSTGLGASSSGGSSVIRHAAPEYMEFSFIFGAFRGMAGVPAARLELLSYSHSAETLSHAGLAVSHPVCSCVRPQGNSIAPNQSFAVYAGNAYTVYLCSGNGRSAMGIGVFSNTRDIVRFVTDIATDDSVETDLSHATYLRICSPDGSASFYDLQTNKFAAYVTEHGYVLTAADALQKLAVVRDEDNRVRQVWSAWDGLADIVPNAAGQGYTISLYLPNQVTPPVDPSSPYTVTGSPFKTFTVSGDSTAGTVSVAERDNSLPASMPDFVTTWSYADGVWSMTTGTGETAVTELRVRQQIDADSYRVVTTRSKGTVMTSRECDVYQISDLGPQIASHTDGYDTPAALTTTYEYDPLGNLVRSVSPNGAERQFRHDAHCRELLVSEPWAEGGQMVRGTVYRDEPGRYCLDPASTHVQAVGADRQVYPVLDAEYTYIETADVKRVEVRTTASASNAEHLSVEETWLAAAANVHARGRVKMRQDVNGVQTHYSYEASDQYGALYRVTAETRVDVVPTPGLSTREVSYYTCQGNLVREERYALSSDGDWLLLSGATHTYDCQNRRIATQHDNGRSSSRTLICTGAILSETDEDGVTTDYSYDSARMLVETTRAAVYDGDTCITPETITEYVRDAEGRATTTTTHAGALTTVTSTAYDAVGRVVAQTDALGRTTTTAYSADGLTTTQTTPSGATLVTTRNTDGSTAHVSGTGQRELKYAYDVSSGRMRTTVRLADNSILSQTLQNGFGETVVETAPSTTGFIYTRSEYNNRGLLTRMYQDTSMGATPTASTLFEYDSFGNVTRRVLALDEEPTPLNSPVEEFAYGVEEGTDGIYSVTTRTRYNAAGTALTSTRKELVSSLSSTLAEKSVAIDERGLTSTEWTEYGAGTVRDSYSAVPTSSITAHRVMVDGFTVSHSDHAGVASTQSRRFTETGLALTQTDGRGNATTTCTDIAGRTVSVTDAAGNTTSTAYNPYFDEPSVVTDACGKTACYKYDIRGRKVAEWGTAIQPACFGYDDADRMTSLATFRAGMETISTDPSSRTDGDVTTWAYHATTGLEVSKTYADGKGTVKTYDAFNRLATETDARGKVKNCSYEHARGLLLEISYSDDTPTESFVYNHLGQLTLVTDSAGIRAFGYNAYGEQETDSLLAEGVTHLVTETRDSFGRSTGYTYTKGDATQQTVTTAYGADGRISGAGFIHGGQEKQFGYTYLQGSHLLQTLTKPNGMTLTQTYEQHRDLLTQMDYKRGNTLVARRAYQYDTLGRPTSRTLARQGAT